MPTPTERRNAIAGAISALGDVAAVAAAAVGTVPEALVRHWAEEAEGDAFQSLPLDGAGGAASGAGDDSDRESKGSASKEQGNGADVRQRGKSLRDTAVATAT